MWQGPRLGFATETGCCVTIDALSKIFFCFCLVFIFLSFPSGVVAVPCYSPCCFVRAPVMCSSSQHVRVLLAAFLMFLWHLCSVSLKGSFCVILFFFRFYFLVSRACSAFVPGTSAFVLLTFEWFAIILLFSVLQYVPS